MANNNSNSNDYYMRYYVYSKTQAQQQAKIHNSMTTNYMVLKKVIVNGIAKPFTEELKSMSDSRYSDAVLVTKGDKRYITIIR